MRELLKENVEISFASLITTGDVFYDFDHNALLLEDDEGPGAEVLSVNLIDYGLVAPTGHVYIKDWSEGSGVTDSLYAAGLIELVDIVFVGPFNSRAYLVKIRNLTNLGKIVEGIKPSTSVSEPK